MEGVNDNLDSTNESILVEEGNTPQTARPEEPMAQTPPNKPVPRFEEKPSPQQPRTLQQEFSLVNINIPKVNIDEVGGQSRTLNNMDSVNPISACNFDTCYPGDKLNFSN
jgi:hypothetical protein